MISDEMLRKAVDAAFPGLPECMSLEEATRRVAAALAAVMPELEQRGAVKAWRYRRPNRGGKVHRFNAGRRVHRFMHPVEDEWEFVSIAHVPTTDLCENCWRDTLRNVTEA